MKRAAPPIPASPASSTSSSERERLRACRACTAPVPVPVPGTPPTQPPLKRERSDRASKPPRAPSPLPHPRLPPPSPVTDYSVRGRVARLLDSYLERTIGPGDDDEDAEGTVAACDKDCMEADFNKEVGANSDDHGKSFRLFADSRPGAIIVASKGDDKTKDNTPVAGDSSDSDESAGHVARLKSVVVEVQPPSQT